MSLGVIAKKEMKVNESKMSAILIPRTSRWYVIDRRERDLRIIQMRMEDDVTDTIAKGERIMAIAFPWPSLHAAPSVTRSSIGITSLDMMLKGSSKDRAT